jgi:hypothetical protein
MSIEPRSLRGTRAPFDFKNVHRVQHIYMLRPHDHLRVLYHKLRKRHAFFALFCLKKCKAKKMIIYITVFFALQLPLSYAFSNCSFSLRIFSSHLFTM